MKIHNLIQGTPEWEQFRLDHFGASEAAAMMGLSSKATRNELLKMKHTGIAKQYSDWVENVLFANGHKYEVKAREIIETEIKDELYPVTCSDGIYSASCDGLTLDGSVAFEHKQWNSELADSIRNGILPDEYMPQCQQILMITGAHLLIFVTSDGTKDNIEKINVMPNHDWVKRIRDGWGQFQIDLDNYQPKDIKEKPQANAIMQLPALAIQIKGEVIASNLPAFKKQAELFIANINTDLKTDEDFADAEANVKYCKETEDNLEAVKKSAIAQTASIDEVMRTIDFIKEELRKKRLDLDKKVKREKENIKASIIVAAKKQYDNHVLELCNEIQPIKLITPGYPDFVGVTKNKRTLESLHNEVDTELANYKIIADSLAKDIRAKLAWYNKNVDGNESLFRDLQSLIYKDVDDFQLVVKTRIADEKRKIAEAEKAAADRAKAEAEDSALKKAKEKEAEIEREKRDADLKRRIEEAQLRDKKAEEEKRKKDKQHHEKIKSEAINSMANQLKIDINMATNIINNIENGKIMHVTINF